MLVSDLHPIVGPEAPVGYHWSAFWNEAKYMSYLAGENMAEIFWEATCSWNMVSIATSIAPTLWSYYVLYTP